MKTAMYAIIKKDFRGVASNRRLFSALLIVPLVLTIVLPSIFVIAIHFVPDDPDVAKLLSLLPEAARLESDEIRITQEPIARHIGSAREAVTRTLKQMAREGLVEVFRGGIRLADRRALYALC